MIVPRLIASKEDTSYISDFSNSILKVPAATSISSEYNIKQKNREKNERPKQLPQLQNIGHLKVQKLSYKIHVCNLNVFLKHQFESQPLWIICKFHTQSLIHCRVYISNQTITHQHHGIAGAKTKGKCPEDRRKQRAYENLKYIK